MLRASAFASPEIGHMMETQPLHCLTRLLNLLHFGLWHLMRLKTKETRKTFEKWERGSSCKTFISIFIQVPLRSVAGIDSSRKERDSLQVLTSAGTSSRSQILRRHIESNQSPNPMVWFLCDRFAWDGCCESSTQLDWKHCHPTGRSPADPEDTYWRRSIRSLLRLNAWICLGIHALELKPPFGSGFIHFCCDSIPQAAKASDGRHPTVIKGVIY